MTIPVRTFTDSPAVKEEGGTPPALPEKVIYRELPDPPPPRKWVTHARIATPSTVGEVLAALKDLDPALPVEFDGFSGGDLVVETLEDQP
jgi:hypothetical protein